MSTTTGIGYGYSPKVTLFNGCDAGMQVPTTVLDSLGVENSPLVQFCVEKTANGFTTYFPGLDPYSHDASLTVNIAEEYLLSTKKLCEQVFATLPPEVQINIQNCINMFQHTYTQHIDDGGEVFSSTVTVPLVDNHVLIHHGGYITEGLVLDFGFPRAPEGVPELYPMEVGEFMKMVNEAIYTVSEIMSTGKFAAIENTPISPETAEYLTDAFVSTARLGLGGFVLLSVLVGALIGSAYVSSKVSSSTKEVVNQVQEKSKTYTEKARDRFREMKERVTKGK